MLAPLLEYIPKIIKQFFTLLCVLIGWVFFFSPTLSSAFMWLGRMFGIGAAGLVDAIARYYFSGIFASFPWGSKLGAKALKGENKLPVYISVVLYAVMLVLCIAGMMSSTYSSFLYFQF